MVSSKVVSWNKYKGILKRFNQPIPTNYKKATTNSINKLIKAFKYKVFDENNELIPRNILKKFKDIKYTVKNHRLVRPVTSKDIPVDDIVTVFEEVKTASSAVVNYVEDDTNKSKIIKFNSVNDFRNQFNEFTKMFSDGTMTSITLIYNQSGTHGPLRDGQLNCVITLIENHVTVHKIPCTVDFNAVYNQFKFGVFKKDFPKLTKQFKFPIKYTDNNQTILYNENTSNHYKYLNIFAHSNHAVAQINEVKKIKYINLMNDYDFNITYETCNGLEDYMLNKIPFNEITNRVISHGMIVSVSTIDTEYRLKFCAGLDLEELKCLTPNQYYFNKCFEYFTIKPESIKSSNPNIESIKDIRTKTINWSKDFEFMYSEVIDLNCAFNNFGVLPTDLSFYYKTSDLTKTQITNLIKMEGFGLIENVQFDDFTIGGWMSMPMIRFLIKNNFVVKISEFMISSDKTTFDINGFMALGIYEKRRFHNVLGSMQSITKVKSSLSTDPVQGGKQVYTNSEYTLYESSTIEDSIGIKFYPHIVGYVHDYTNIKMITKYLELRKMGIQVLRMWVDGIYYKKSNKKITINNEWKFETKDKQPLFKESEQSIKNTSLQSFSTQVNINPEQFIAYIGKAGCGKSYKLEQIYQQNSSNTIILTPTNLLKTKYLNKGYNAVTFEKFIQSNDKSLNFDSYKIILIDEYTMMSPKVFDKILQIASSMKQCYVFGDTAQIINIDKIVIDTSAFKVIELTKNYRQLDKKFQSNLDSTRETGDISYIKQRITIEDAIKQNKMILSSRNVDITKINNIGFQLNQNKEQFGFKVNSPILFTQNRKEYNNGDSGIITKIDDKFIYVNDTIKLTHEQAKNNTQLYYSCTFHRFQGQTIENIDIVINTNKLFDKVRMLYVATSRVTKAEQLFILI